MNVMPNAGETREMIDSIREAERGGRPEDVVRAEVVALLRAMSDGDYAVLRAQRLSFENDRTPERAQSAALFLRVYRLIQADNAPRPVLPPPAPPVPPRIPQVPPRERVAEPVPPPRFVEELPPPPQRERVPVRGIHWTQPSWLIPAIVAVVIVVLLLIFIPRIRFNAMLGGIKDEGLSATVDSLKNRFKDQTDKQADLDKEKDDLRGDLSKAAETISAVQRATSPAKRLKANISAVEQDSNREVAALQRQLDAIKEGNTSLDEAKKAAEQGVRKTPKVYSDEEIDAALRIAAARATRK